MIVPENDSLERGRTAFQRHTWAEAVELLTQADRNTPLEPHDLEQLATAAFLVGQDDAAGSAWASAYAAHLAAGDPRRALRCAFWLIELYDNRNEPSRAQGWLTRAEQALEDCGADCVERGHVRMAQAMRTLGQGDLPGALDAFRNVIEIAERFGDRDLRAFGTMGAGRVLTLLGQRDAGFALLDELMVSVVDAEVSPIVMGQAYCMVIEACHRLLELSRAAEWTDAFRDWCESHPDMAAFRGDCLLYRAEILQIHGAWQDALDDIDRACVRLREPRGQSALATALYQKAELHRLRGEEPEAEQAYRDATRLGKQADPGLALLRLGQGHVGAATAMISRAVGEAAGAESRARLLPAYVEILLEAGDIKAARAGADELRTLAGAFDAAYLRAAAAYADGHVLCAEGRSAEALPRLRTAWSLWQTLPAPYEAARTRVLLARCCRALGDETSADIELDAARWALRQLGATLDVARLDSAGAEQDVPGAAGNLTAREMDVLRLVAAGHTNRVIAGELIISEKTVARHMSNIFAKIGVSSRAAATAFAYEHHLV